MNQNDLLKELLKTGESRFASVVYTSKETGEKARFLVLLNAHYRPLLQHDLAVLSRTTTGRRNSLMSLAKLELETSLRASLEPPNPQYTKPSYYTRLVNGLPVKYHKDVQYFDGLVMSKKVIRPSRKAPVNHSEKTLAKNKLRKLLKTNKFREFRLDSVEAARINGKTINMMPEMAQNFLDHEPDGGEVR